MSSITDSVTKTSEGAADPLENRPPPRPDYKSVRQEITKAIGRDTLNDLSKGNIWKDLWWGFWPPAAVIITAVAIGLIDNWWIRVPLIAFNGFNVANCGVVAHSMCSHRRPFGRRLSQVHGTFLTTISVITFSIDTATHMHHHNTVNTPQDQDAEQVNLDTRLKRALYATIFGYSFASSKMFIPTGMEDRAWNGKAYFRKQLLADPKRRWDVIAETAFIAVFWVGIAVGSLWKPEFFILGYVVPMLATAALANGLRQATEHHAVDISSPWHIANTSRPGWVRRVWLHQSGTTHWVHHMWPNMPHYNCLEAWDLMYPHIKAHGVVEDGSFWAVARRYYLEGEPRAHWTDAETGEIHQAGSLTEFGDPEYASAHR